MIRTGLRVGEGKNRRERMMETKERKIRVKGKSRLMSGLNSGSKPTHFYEHDSLDISFFFSGAFSKPLTGSPKEVFRQSSRLAQPVTNVYIFHEHRRAPQN